MRTDFKKKNREGLRLWAQALSLSYGERDKKI